MTNSFYNVTGTPANRATGASAAIRAEFAAIDAAFSKFLTLAGNAGALLQVDATGMLVIAATSINALAIGSVTPSSGAFTSLTATTLATGTLTASGNSVLGDAVTDTLNVGAGGLIKDSSGRTILGVPVSGNGLTALLNGAGDAVQTGYSATNTSSRVALGVEATNLAVLYYERSTGEFGLASATTAAGALTKRLSLSAIGSGFGPSAAAPSYGGQLFGFGQATNNPTDAGAVGGTLMLYDTQGAANNGGLLAFGAFNTKGFAGIKGLLTDGSNNSVGDLSFSNRRVSSDAGYTENLRLTANGRLYGTALHNNTGPVTGTTNQYVASGTYTPTLTGFGAPAPSATPMVWSWVRVGNVVTVGGEFSATTGNAGGNGAAIEATLPPVGASSFASVSMVSGVVLDASFVDGLETGYVDTFGDHVQIVWRTYSTTPHRHKVHFIFVIT